MDGLPGLEKVFSEEFSNAKIQRCQVHVAKNILAKVPMRLKSVVAEMSALFGCRESYVPDIHVYLLFTQIPGRFFISLAISVYPMLEFYKYRLFLSVLSLNLNYIIESLSMSALKLRGLRDLKGLSRYLYTGFSGSDHPC